VWEGSCKSQRHMSESDLSAVAGMKRPFAQLGEDFACGAEPKTSRLSAIEHKTPRLSAIEHSAKSKSRTRWTALWRAAEVPEPPGSGDGRGLGHARPSAWAWQGGLSGMPGISKLHFIETKEERFCAFSDQRHHLRVPKSRTYSWLRAEKGLDWTEKEACPISATTPTREGGRAVEGGERKTSESLPSRH